MDSGYYAACTALKTQTSALELAANNIANVNTTGYRGQIPSFHSMMVETAGGARRSGWSQLVNEFAVLNGTRLDLGQGNDIRIEGHTDNVPIHNSRFASNWDLSTARATTTVRLLIQDYDFRPKRLAASGYASIARSLPITAEGRAMNRRVDVVIPRKSGQA